MKKLFFAILILFSGVLQAQHIKIAGRTLDSQTSEVLPFTNAAIYTTADTLFVRGASSDISGSFTIGGVTAGTYIMRVTMVGYQPWERTMNVTKDINLGDIALEQGALLSEVVVEAVRPIFTMDGERNIYNTVDDPSIQTGTAVDALQNAPGIEVDAEGNVRLRGTQEVGIWINGRENRMNEEALKQYLKTLPANSIKRIEVITNPSARYGGGRPVVNIVTRGKSVENRFLSVGLNSSTKPELMPWLSYIHSSEKWDIDIYANLGYAHDSTAFFGNDALLTPLGDTSRTDVYRCATNKHTTNTMMAIDVAYHSDSLTTLYLWYSAFAYWSDLTYSNQTNRREFIYWPGDYSFSETMAKLNSKPSRGFFDGIWYEHMFDDSTGHTLMFGYFGSAMWNDSLISASRRYAVNPQNDIDYQCMNKGSDWFHAVELAYMLPFGSRDTATGVFKNELEAGFEGFYHSNSSAVAVDTVGNHGSARCGWLSSNTVLHNKNASLYASYLRRWGSFTIKGGLRGEMQSGHVSYPDAPTHDFSHTDFMLVPSVHVTYSSPRNSSFAFSYTRRMSAPQINDYSSRRFYRLDEFSVGNPLLKKGCTHNVEFKFDKYLESSSFGVNVFYSALTNQLGTLTDVVFENDVFQSIVTFSQPVNIGSASNGGADFHAVYRPNAFLNVRFNGSVFYDYLNLQFRDGTESYRSGMWCYSLRLNAWVKLWNQVQLFGNVYYNSPTQSLFSTTLSRKGIDIGANADLLRHRLSINLCMKDIFDWNGWSTTSSNPYFASDVDVKMLSRYASLGLTFRFGQMELEREPRRSMRRQPTEFSAVDMM